VSWADGAVCVESTFAVDVDWARDGMILTPSTVLTGRPAVVAEEPDPPQLIYPHEASGRCGRRLVRTTPPRPPTSSARREAAQLLG